MKISVLITTYNNAQFILSAVYSILHQTYKDFELVIVDDGSTDNTRELINSVNDERINYHRIEHVKRSKALNYGLGICNNEWVALMDADDICHPRRLEIELKALTENKGLDIISSWYAIFSSNKIHYITKTPEHNNSIKKSLLLHSVISNPGVIFRKSLILDKGGYSSMYDDYGIEDYNLWLKLITKATFYNIQQTLIFHRYRTSSASRKNLRQTADKIYVLQMPYIKAYLNNFSDSDKNILLGWREYFYGKKKRAWHYWKKLHLKILLRPRILAALTFLVLPEKYFTRFKELRIRLRLNYLLTYFSKNNIESRRFLGKILSENYY